MDQSVNDASVGLVPLHLHPYVQTWQMSEIRLKDLLEHTKDNSFPYKKKTSV